MRITQANSFKRVVKKMHPNQKEALDDAVKAIVQDPETSPLKTGDLSNLRVYKYKLHGAQMLLGYNYNEQEQILNLVSIGPHENFYRDIKR